MICKAVLSMCEIDIFNKEAFKTDLALIKSCLRLIHLTITLTKQNGETFTASDNEEIHNLISKIDKICISIIVNTCYK